MTENFSTQFSPFYLPTRDYTIIFEHPVYVYKYINQLSILECASIWFCQTWNTIMNGNNNLTIKLINCR